MKIRTDFVTNSSSSSFVCEKTSTFQVADKDGNVSDMTFYYESFESYFDVKKIQVPDIINKYLLDHYIKTGKTASPKRLMDSLVKGEQTPMIKEFMDSAELQSISGPTSFLTVESAYISEDINSHYEELFDALIDNGITNASDLVNISAFTNFVKICKDTEKYNFVTGDFDRDFVRGTQNFDFFRLAEQIVEGFEKENLEKKSLEYYYSGIIENNHLPQDVIEAIKFNEIIIIFFARGTGICDEIIWYRGEFNRGNLRVHLFEEKEELADIEDNTEKVLNLAGQVYALKANTQEPLSKKEITDLASKEKKVKPTEKVSVEFNKTEIISLTKEEAKGVWTTAKDVLGRVQLTGYKGEETDTLRVPSVIDGKEIDMIGYYGGLFAKDSGKNIRNIVIGDGIKFIGKGTFVGLPNLEKITIPTSVTCIYPYAFDDKVDPPTIQTKSYEDFVVESIGEYTGQIPIEKKGVMYTGYDVDYDFKALISSLGAVYHYKPNGNTGLLLIPDYFWWYKDIREKLKMAIDFAKEGKANLLAAKKSVFINDIVPALQQSKKESNQEKKNSQTADYGTAFGSSDSGIKFYDDIKGKIFVTTGLGPEQEEKVRAIAEKYGGIFKGNFVVSLNYLVYDPQYGSDTVKHKKAEEQIAKGKDVKIISWDEYEEMISKLR